MQGKNIYKSKFTPFKYKSIYDSKIILLELNFYSLEQIRFDSISSTQKLLRELAASQNLLIITDAPIEHTLNAIKTWNLEGGYLITNSGSCIYSLGSKKIIYSQSMDNLFVKNIIKQAIWNNLNFVLNTEKNGSFIFQIQTWLIQKYSFDLNRLLDLKDRELLCWERIIDLLEHEQILSVEIFFYEPDIQRSNAKIKKFVENLKEFWEFNYVIQDGILFLFDGKNSKLIASLFMANRNEISFDNNSLYIAVDNFSEELLKSSYFSLISDQLLLKNQNKNILPFISSTLYVGKDNWKQWLKKHEYLWAEPVELKYKNMFSSLNLMCNKHEIEKLWEEQNIKYFFINEREKSVFINMPTINKSNKSPCIAQHTNITQIFIWPSQLQSMLWYLTSKKTTDEQ